MGQMESWLDTEMAIDWALGKFEIYAGNTEKKNGLLANEVEHGSFKICPAWRKCSKNGWVINQKIAGLVTVVIGVGFNYPRLQHAWFIRWTNGGRIVSAKSKLRACHWRQALWQLK